MEADQAFPAAPLLSLRHGFWVTLRPEGVFNRAEPVEVLERLVYLSSGFVIQIIPQQGEEAPPVEYRLPRRGLAARVRTAIIPVAQVQQRPKFVIQKMIQCGHVIVRSDEFRPLLDLCYRDY